MIPPFAKSRRKGGAAPGRRKGGRRGPDCLFVSCCDSTNAKGVCGMYSRLKSPSRQRQRRSWFARDRADRRFWASIALFFLTLAAAVLADHFGLNMKWQIAVILTVGV